MSLLSSYIDKFKDVKVLVIGDIMLDRFIYGKVERISPEAPVPVFKYDHEKKMLGGAGNVVANLTSLGCKTTFLGIIGDDANGKTVSYLLRKINAKSHFLRLSDYPTIVKTRLVSANQHITRIDQEEILPINENLIPRFKKILINSIKNVDVVLISDYNKGLLTPITTQIIINICNQLGKKSIIDPKGSDYSKYIGATLVKPNLKEFSEATGKKYLPTSKTFHKDVSLGAKVLFDKYNIKNLIVTLSEYGMLYVSSENNKEVDQIPTQAKEVYDVSGAGDTSLATLGASLGADVSIKDAMKLANLASGIVVGKLGTATVTSSELKDAISTRETTTTEWKQKKKIITLSQAKEIIKDLREKGKKIGFTNGCFDCCHLGHIHSFMEAKKLCDVLVVALNSDTSIKRYKGQERPIQDEKTRAMVLASMEFIDYIIVFSEDNPLHIVDALRPDIIAKEGYPMDKWAEGRFVQSYGGKAVILERLEGYSTSNLVKKMKG
ncbi:MAG: D-glycero-beta-D-manno-heptose-7-phosphate kinase [Alphaproteobacteria bacterium]|nr:D-glycero-beta-D-manno-heptose-7-phosphate kinase [Alphaproteobacteria bacterium]